MTMNEESNVRRTSRIPTVLLLWSRRASFGDAGKLAVVEAGAIPPLVELLRQGSEKTKVAAAGALRTLAVGDRGEVAVVEAAPELLKN